MNASEQTKLKQKFPYQTVKQDCAPIVLAIRIGDWIALVNGKAEIVAQVELNPVIHVDNGKRKALS